MDLVFLIGIFHKIWINSSIVLKLIFTNFCHFFEITSFCLLNSRLRHFAGPRGEIIPSAVSQNRYKYFWAFLFSIWCYTTCISTTEGGKIWISMCSSSSRYFGLMSLTIERSVKVSYSRIRNPGKGWNFKSTLESRYTILTTDFIYITWFWQTLKKSLTNYT